MTPPSNLDDPISDYRDIISWGEPIFAELDANDRLKVLKAGCDAGVKLSELQPNNPKIALDEFYRVIRIGEPFFAELNQPGRIQVLRAGYCAATILKAPPSNNPQARLAACRRIVMMAEPVFEELGSDGWNLMLWAGYEAGQTLASQPLHDPHDILTEYQRVARLGELVFVKMEANIRTLVVASAHNAGVLLGGTQVNDPHGALEEYRRVARLSEQAFLELTAADHAIVLRSGCNAAALLLKASPFDSPHRAMDELRRVIRLGELLFADLDPEGKTEFRRALSYAGQTLKEHPFSATQEALDAFRRVVQLGALNFAELDEFEHLRVLDAGMMAGDMFVRLHADDPRGAVKEYRRVIELGEPLFSKFNATCRAFLLHTGRNAALESEKLQDAGLHDALAEYRRIIRLGEPVFAVLDARGKTAVLVAGFRASRILGKPPFNDPLSEMSECRRVVRLGETVLEELPDEGRRQVLLAIISLASFLFGNEQSRQLPIVQTVILMRPLLADVKSGDDIILWFEKILHPQHIAAISPVSVSSAVAALHWWLCNLRSFPVTPVHKAQRRQVIKLSSTLANKHCYDDQYQKFGHRNCVEALCSSPNTGGQDGLSRVLSQWATDQVFKELEGALSYNSLDGLLLARVQATIRKDLKTDGWPEAAPWNTEPQKLYARLGIDQLFPHGDLMLAHYVWLQRANEPRLNITLFSGVANNSNGELAEALRAWRAGDHSMAAAMLNRAWLTIERSGYERDGVEISYLAALSNWFERLGLSASAALRRARDALIYRDVREELQRAFHKWIIRELQTAQATGEASYTGTVGGIFRRLLSWLPVPTSNAAILERLQQFLQAQIEDSIDDPSLLWVTLEMQRFALSSAAGFSIQPSDPSSTTLKFINRAFDAELSYLRTKISRIESGQAESTKSPESHDITFAFFETLGAELDRLGYALKLADVNDCAAELSTDEHLAQIWFAANGSAYALILSRDGDKPRLRNEPMGPGLAFHCWEALIEYGKKAHDTAACAARDPARQEEADLASQQAWATFVGPQSPATLLLHEIRQQLAGSSAGTIRCNLILPAELARLPWLARAVSGVTDGVGDFQAGEFVLEASATTWLTARRATFNESVDAAPAQVVYVSHGNDGLYGSAEATSARQAIGAIPVAMKGIVEVTRALQAPGPTHLIVHGAFSPFDPSGSFLTIDGKAPDLPAWLLPAITVRGDVSLSVCNAMLVGQGTGESQWSGPVGIGPLLRACGARSVIGPLGVQNQLASLLFYSLWFELRRTLSAVQALAEAQRRLRTMTKADAIKRVTRIDRKLVPHVQSHFLSSPKGSALFNTPSLWAQFTLLGDSPRLPVMIDITAQIIQTTRDVVGWFRWIWLRLRGNDDE